MCLPAQGCAQPGEERPEEASSTRTSREREPPMGLHSDRGRLTWPRASGDTRRRGADTHGSQPPLHCASWHISPLPGSQVQELGFWLIPKPSSLTEKPFKYAFILFLDNSFVLYIF
ncbi:unnamed protein product [Pipistrellus nathusii]|uniref:Uncharacterized protein n=1 Tax=Pipistrellus nathusii TaxID=59473 RepID=A0ABP0AAL3_PIPNA